MSRPNQGRRVPLNNMEIITYITLHCLHSGSSAVLPPSLVRAVPGFCSLILFHLIENRHFQDGSMSPSIDETPAHTSLPSISMVMTSVLLYVSINPTSVSDFAFASCAKGLHTLIVGK